MSQNDPNPLSERVEELEQLVGKLRNKITLLEGQLEEEKRSKAPAPTPPKSSFHSRITSGRNGHSSSKQNYMRSTIIKVKEH